MSPIERDYYSDLFTQDPCWSTPYPNIDEAKRWSAMCPFVATATAAHTRERPIRILEVGCGRGWLTNCLSVFGECEGIDPVPAPVALAARRYPHLSFRAATLDELLQTPGFRPYDVVVASEVLEHVTDKDEFARQIRRCLVPKGHLILTTPRGEWFRRWRRAKIGGDGQPVEEWLTERQLKALFTKHGYLVKRHERVYLGLPGLSPLHWIADSPKLRRLLNSLHLTLLAKALEYVCGFYQAWWFQIGSEG